MVQKVSEPSLTDQQIKVESMMSSEKIKQLSSGHAVSLCCSTQGVAAKLSGNSHKYDAGNASFPIITL